MKIIISTFSSVRTVCGFSEKNINLNDNSTVGDITKILFHEFSELANMKGKLLFALNEEYCDENKLLREGDKLAIFPPVSGG